MEVKNKGIVHYRSKSATEIYSSNTVMTVFAISFFVSGFMT